jgi:RES domain-containing protein
VDYVLLTGVLLVAFAFAAAPQVPALRRLLRAPDDEGLVWRGRVRSTWPTFVSEHTPVMAKRGRPAPLRELSGAFVRVAATNRDPLGAPPDLAFVTLASDLRAAWAGTVREARRVDGLVHRVRRRVASVQVDALRVIDLTDPAVRAASGLSAQDVVSHEREPRTRVMEAAVWAQAEGILLPSRHVPDAQELRVFTGAVAEHVTIVQVEEQTLGLEALALDPRAREVLSDEATALDFQRALRDGRFDAWRRELQLDRAAVADLERVAAALPF